MPANEEPSKYASSPAPVASSYSNCLGSKSEEENLEERSYNHIRPESSCERGKLSGISPPKGAKQRSNQNKFGTERPGGWYASRRAYRSVAYRTWKVGSARKLLSSENNPDLATSDTEEYARRPNMRKGLIPSSASYGPDRNLFDGESESCLYWSFHPEPRDKSADSNNSRMCTSSESFWRRAYFSRDSNDTLNDVLASPVARNYWGDDSSATFSDQEGPLTDCFSAQDYCKFQNLKQNLRQRNGITAKQPARVKAREKVYSSTTSTDFSDGEASDEHVLMASHSSVTEIDQSLQNVMENFRQLQNFVTMRPKKSKSAKADDRPRAFHRRSQSAGNATIFCATGTPKHQIFNDANNNQKNKQNSHHFGSLAATKKFLKKLYRSHKNCSETGKGSSSENGDVKNKKNGKSSLKVPKKASLAKLESSSSGNSTPNFKFHTNDTPSNDELIRKTAETFASVSSERKKITENSTASTKIPGQPNNSPFNRNHFTTLDEACSHLKQELNNIRARDVMILKRFQRLEQDLRVVKPPVDGPSPIVELPPNLEDAFSMYTSFSDPFSTNAETVL